MPFFMTEKIPRLWTHVYCIYDWRGGPGSNERNGSVQPAQQKWKTIAKQREGKKRPAREIEKRRKRLQLISIRDGA